MTQPPKKICVKDGEVFVVRLWNESRRLERSACSSEEVESGMGMMSFVGAVGGGKRGGGGKGRLVIDYASGG